ncbi:MAG: hypothetical protein LBN43_01440 [Oscillospiraceae bacterium]|jgi:hypothetical protein|nr:hypothetical protein [Oscillospiraceae bacterium]
MKITNYAVTAKSKREYLLVESSRMTEKQVVIPPAKTGKSEKAAKLDLSDSVKQMLKDSREQQKRQLDKMKANILGAHKAESSEPAADKDGAKITALELMLQMLTGKKVRLHRVELKPQSSDASLDEFAAKMQSLTPTVPQGTTVLERETEVFRFESERLSYNATGLIQTADGKSISIDISMNMSRQSSFYLNVKSQQQVAMCDPLVINYSGTAASLSGEKFEFDLDIDGKADNISFAGEGSGFLALDRNGDGKINDGSELFGPKTGSGFGELRELDDDGNGWIDENDDIYSKLRIWSKDKDGNDQLFTLKELDVGAIFLGDLETKFGLDGGQMRSTSFFLKDSGGAGFVSHIDLNV